MAKIVQRYKDAWANPYFRISLMLAVPLFVGALFVNFWAIEFATERAGGAVPDIILSNTPAIEVDGLFVYGTMALIAFAALILLAHPGRIPFSLLGVTLFILMRSAFTLMTHLGTPELNYDSDFGDAVTSIFFGADQFFSGHTGMPFLGALAFWHLPFVRNVFLAASVYFAGVVLLGHIHYTIDVASAFFITYGIYHLALWLFPRERALFTSSK